MRVYYKNNGDVDFTLTPAADFPGPLGAYIEVPDGTSVDLMGHVVIDGELTLRASVTQDQKNVALEEITAKRGRARRAFITDLPGQDMVYLEKRSEAITFLAHPEPTSALFPMIYAEVGITGSTSHEVAQVWLNMSELWRGVSTVIEQVTLRAAEAVGAAKTMDEISAALGEMNEALADLGAL